MQDLEYTEKEGMHLKGQSAHSVKRSKYQKDPYMPKFSGFSLSFFTFINALLNFPLWLYVRSV